MRFEDVHDLADIGEGMVLPGVITNVTGFGAFVDVGVHTDGLVHISRLSSSFVKHPTDVVAVGQWVTVRVIGIDMDRRRLSLSMEGTETAAGGKAPVRQT